MKKYSILLIISLFYLPLKAQVKYFVGLRSSFNPSKSVSNIVSSLNGSKVTIDQSLITSTSLSIRPVVLVENKKGKLSEWEISEFSFTKDLAENEVFTTNNGSINNLSSSLTIDKNISVLVTNRSYINFLKKSGSKFSLNLIFSKSLGYSRTVFKPLVGAQPNRFENKKYTFRGNVNFSLGTNYYITEKVLIGVSFDQILGVYIDAGKNFVNDPTILPYRREVPIFDIFVPVRIHTYPKVRNFSFLVSYKV